MRGYSTMSDKERQQIIKQHAQVYDGYSTGNVPSNMAPLTVYDFAKDKGGITVDSMGNVKEYKNHGINEIAAKNLHYDEIDEPFNFVSGGPADPFREDYDFEESDFEPLEEDDVEKWKDTENPEVESIEESVVSINKTLDMFKRFKKYN
jgi:hypothetical protein